MGETLRAFVAFELPEEILQHARSLQASLKEMGVKLRWVKPQNIHLTLKFLGQIPVAHIAAVETAMQSAVQGQGPLRLTVQGMGVFPGIKRPRVLWTGLGGNLDCLQKLALRLETALESQGFAREKRPFKAHLTLARIKTRPQPQRLLHAIEKLGHYPPLAFTAKQMVLFESELRPQGAIYTSKVRVGMGQ